MMLVDQTIVAVATPAIMDDLHADHNQAVWVTSAFLLTFAAPLLVTGRLGDQLGQKRMFLAGLTVFVVASALCGLARTPEVLIGARALQGLGAAMLAPQSMSIITRVFPPERRGTAMGIWGGVAGLATLVGPVLGGPLTDSFGWEWVFFVNVPVGVVTLVLAWRWIPLLGTESRSFDVVGIVLSSLGMLLLVLGLQEGERRGWDAVTWVSIGAGVLVLLGFLRWQGITRREPLVPLSLFRVRNFSLANVAITTMGFAVTGTMVPLMLYAQSVRGFSPTEAAMLLVPMAIVSGILAPVAGRLVNTGDPRIPAVVGYSAMVSGLLWLWAEMGPDTPLWRLLLPVAVLGVGNGFAWSPTSTTATRGLSHSEAGAGAGVYNTTRQVGAVLGSAALGALMQARIRELGPEAARAYGDPMLLAAAVMLIGLVAVVLFVPPAGVARRAPAAARR